MGYTIAVAGKGGTGKTTLAALMVRLLKEKKAGSVLAVDADPNNNLSEALGVEIKETVGSILDEISQHPEKIPPGMPKERFIEYRLQTSIAEGEGFDLLSMGRPEGPGCYCYVNNVLRNIVGRLVKDYDFIVIDNEAGFEHLSRRTMRSCDALVIVSDATPVGLKAAERISGLIEELDIKSKKKLLLINYARESIKKERIEKLGLDYVGDIPKDPRISKASLNGGSLMDLNDDAVSLNALRKLGDKIWLK
ncbi:MAG: AAA family ATPase [Candidatus Omnitrophota bacterium]